MIRLGECRQLAEFINHLFAKGRLPSKHVKKVGTRTLRAWRDAYRRVGLRGLIRSMYPTRGCKAFGAKAKDYILSHRHAGTKISLALIRRDLNGWIQRNKLQDDPDWALPSVSSVRKWYRDDVPLAVKVYADRGPHIFRALCLPKVTRSLEDIPAGSHVVGDERVMDFMVRMPGDRGWRRVRPKLSAFMDVRSRYFAGWVLSEFANSDSILSSFRAACETMETIPDEVTIDNGRDYRSVGGRARRNRKWDEFDPKRVFPAFERLGVTAHYALNKHPWSKSIESRFHVVKDRFDRYMASFWGGRPEERPWDADAWTRERIDLLPTMEEASDMFAAFLAALHEEPVAGDGMFNLCPRQALAQFFTPSPRRPDAAALLYACTRMHGPVKIGRDGIRHRNIRYGKFDESAFRMMGKEVYFLADPGKADHITVCDQDGVPLFTAYADRNLGQTVEEVRAAARARQRAERMVKEYPGARDTLLRTPLQEIMEQRAIAAKARQVPDGELPAAPTPQSVRLVCPAIVTGAAEVARAAGAETLRRLSGMNSAAEAMNINRPRPITLADLNGRAETEPAEDPPARRMTLQELNQLTEADCNAP